MAAWRQLAARPPVAVLAGLAEVVELLGLRWDDRFAGIPGEIDALTCSGRPAPFAAAAIAGQIVALSSGAELLAWWCADLALAQSLRWPKPVPLLMAQVFTPIFLYRRDTRFGEENKAGRENFERAVCLAVAQGAAEACRLGAEISRRAERLAAITPKLRARRGRGGDPKTAGRRCRLRLADGEKSVALRGASAVCAAEANSENIETLSSRISANETTLRKIDIHELRLSNVEKNAVDTAGLIKSLDGTLNGLTADMKVTKEIMMRIEAAQKARFQP